MPDRHRVGRVLAASAGVGALAVAAAGCGNHGATTKVSSAVVTKGRGRIAFTVGKPSNADQVQVEISRDVATETVSHTIAAACPHVHRRLTVCVPVRHTSHKPVMADATVVAASGGCATFDATSVMVSDFSVPCVVDYVATRRPGTDGRLVLHGVTVKGSVATLGSQFNGAKFKEGVTLGR